jgi:hypothetical protein
LQPQFSCPSRAPLRTPGPPRLHPPPWSLLRADPRLLATRLPAGETWPESAAIIEAKTGTADGVSWWVGRITGHRGAHVFVSRVDGLPASRTSAALSAGLRALADAGLL